MTNTWMLWAPCMKIPGRKHGGSNQGEWKSTLRAKSGQRGSMEATRAQHSGESERGDSCQEGRINKASVGFIRFDSDFETILLLLMCCSFLPLLFFWPLLAYTDLLNLVVKVTQSCPTLATPWTVAHKNPLSMGFSRQEYWNGFPFLSPGNLPNPGIEHMSSALQADSLPTEPFELKAILFFF